MCGAGKRFSRVLARVVGSPPSSFSVSFTESGQAELQGLLEAKKKKHFLICKVHSWWGCIDQRTVGTILYLLSEDTILHIPEKADTALARAGSELGSHRSPGPPFIVFPMSSCDLGHTCGPTEGRDDGGPVRD